MKYRFGPILREVRERRGMTLRELASKAGLSGSLISQIERNKVSPAIDTLLKLVDVLDMDLDHVFKDFKKDRSVNLVRAEDRKRTTVAGTVYERLSHTVSSSPERRIEAYYLKIPPGGSSGSDAYGHIGEELGVVLSGKGECAVGNRAYELAEGDSISFSSASPHRLRNTGKKPLAAFWVVTPPKRDTERS
jgi:transcriptional regulator with XRE-family HTH domain